MKALSREDTPPLSRRLRQGLRRHDATVWCVFLLGGGVLGLCTETQARSPETHHRADAEAIDTEGVGHAYDKTLDGQEPARDTGTQVRATAALDALYRSSDAEPVALSLPLNRLLKRLMKGENNALREELSECMVGPERCEPGAVSVFLAAGGQPQSSLGELMARYPNEPRVFALAARRARAQGRFTEAASWVQAGMRTMPPDAMLIEEAAYLGWRGADRLAGLHLPAGTTPDSDPDSTVYWFFFLGTLIALGLGLCAWLERDLTLTSALVIGLFGAFAAIPALPEKVERPHGLPSVFWAPLSGGSCQLSPPIVEADHLSILAACEGDRATFRLTKVEGPRSGFMTSDRHRLDVFPEAALNADLQSSASQLMSRVKDAEAEGWTLSAPDAPPMTPQATRQWPSWLTATSTHRIELRVSAALNWAAVWAALLWLMIALRRSARSARTAPRWILVCLAVGVAAHLLTPSRMAMVYGGYDLVSQLVEGVTPRYGTGALWLYGPLFWMFGGDHTHLLTLNRVLGLCCLVASFYLGGALWAHSRQARQVGLVVLFCLPVVVRSHTIESIVVFPALLLLIGLHGLTRVKPTYGRSSLLAGAAALSRPELTVVLALIPLWYLSQRRRPLNWRAALSACVPLICTLGLSATHLVAQTGQLMSEGALPQTDTRLWGFFSAIDYPGIVSNPNHTPLGLWLMLGVGVWCSPQRRAAIGTLGLALGWLAVTGIDLAAVSVPRLHVPALLLIVPLAAVGAVEIWRRFAHHGRWGQFCKLAAITVLSLQLSWTAYANFRPVNEDHEEQLWRDALHALPETPGCLSTVWFGDPSEGAKTPRHVPTYLIDDIRPGWQLIKLTDLDDRASLGCSGETFVLLGMRCHANLRADWSVMPPSETPLKLCRDVVTQYTLKAVLERDVRNYGDLAYPMYPASERLQIGLYQLEEPNDPVSAP